MGSARGPLSAVENRGSYSLVPTDAIASANGVSCDGHQHQDPLLHNGMDSEGAPAALDCRTKADRALQSPIFLGLIATIICSNAAAVGMETDMPQILIWDEVECFFLLVFTAELCLRLLVMGPAIYFDPASDEIAWNLLDVFVVVAGLVDLVGSWFESAASGGGGETIFRVLRLMRILKLFRVIPALRQLYTLAWGLLIAMRALFGVSMMMLSILYVLALVLVRHVHTISEETEYFEVLQEKFRHIPMAMLTLFELMVHPNLEPFHSVIGHHLLLTMFIISFVIFGSFGMIALLSGVIQEAMFEKNALKMEEQQDEHAALRAKLLLTSKELFNHVEVDSHGEARTMDLVHLLPKVAEMFRSSNLPFACPDELEQVAAAMDMDSSGTISKAEFDKFVEQMAEGVRPLLVMELRHDLVGYIGRRIDGIENQLREDGERQKAERCEALRRSPDGQDHSAAALGAGVREMLQSQHHELRGRIDQALLLLQAENAPASKGIVQSKEPPEVLSSRQANVGPQLASAVEDVVRSLEAEVREMLRTQHREIRGCIDVALAEQRSVTQLQLEGFHIAASARPAPVAPQANAPPLPAAVPSHSELQAPLTTRNDLFIAAAATGAVCSRNQAAVAECSKWWCGPTTSPSRTASLLVPPLAPVDAQDTLRSLAVPPPAAFLPAAAEAGVSGRGSAAGNSSRVR